MRWSHFHNIEHEILYHLFQKDDNVDVTTAAAAVATVDAADDDDDNSDYVNKSNILFSRFRHFISLFCWLSQSVWVCMCVLVRVLYSTFISIFCM